jgi:hypothetical protein
VTPALSAVYEELLARASRPPHESHSETWRAAFEARTGVFDAEHASYDARVAAGWEDALIAGGLALAIARELEDQAEQTLATVLARAQRGVFRPETVGKHHAVRELWGGGLFLLLPRDEVSRADGTHGDTVFVGRIVAGTDGCAVLPGRVWLPGEATPLLDALLEEADVRGMDADAFADAILRMDHAYATLSRVKVGYAFRAAALALSAR